MEIKKKKKWKKEKYASYSSVHQKIARTNSGNTITAKKFLRKLDKQNDTKYIQEEQTS